MRARSSRLPPLSHLNDPPQPFEHFHNGGNLPYIGDGGFPIDMLSRLGCWLLIV